MAKIEKLEDILEPDPHMSLLTLKDKINELIDALSCSICGEVKPLNPVGMCFGCYLKKENKSGKRN